LFPVRTLWTLALNNQLTRPPAFDAACGYFAIERQRLVAYDLRSGALKWLVSADPLMAPVVGDALLFLTEPGMLTALHTADGSVAWQLPFTERLVVAPAWDNGWLVVATSDNAVLTFRAIDGHLIWRHSLGSPAHARPALAADRVYIGTDDGRIVALQVETGEPVWERTLGAAPNDMLALDTRLYVGSKDNYFYCLLAEHGEVDWRWRTGADVIGMPVIDDRRVYFVSLDNLLRALDRISGAQQWKAVLPFRPTGGPVKAGEALIVAGLSPSMNAYNAKDGKPAGEIAAGAELAAPPHLQAGTGDTPPVLIAVTRDIAKGAGVSAITHAIEPPLLPMVPLPNLTPMLPVPAPPNPGGPQRLNE
jgi:outer membrane protein assembly factor BamB